VKRRQGLRSGVVARVHDLRLSTVILGAVAGPRMP